MPNVPTTRTTYDIGWPLDKGQQPQKRNVAQPTTMLMSEYEGQIDQGERHLREQRFDR